MNELYLHAVWREKKIGPIGLSLTDNRSCSIIHYGFYNEALAGPDFSMGIIDIDGIEEVGPIEMHLRASDWYRHGHQHDSKYNNVILHVVYNYDMDVVQNGRKIPTLNLAPLLSTPNFRVAAVQNETFLPCHSLLEEISEVIIEKAKQESFVLKLENKLKISGVSDYDRSAIYRLIAAAFGTYANKEQFLLLTDSVPVESLLGKTSEEIYDLLVDTSGLFSKNEYEKLLWNFKGLRPANFPTIRIKQFAFLVSQLLFDQHFIKSANEFDVLYLRDCLISLNGKLKPRLSQSFLEHLIINAFVPYFYHKNKKDSIDTIVNYLQHIKAEKNTATRRWEANGLSVKTAFDSQSLNGLYKYLCTDKKCLSCCIGNAIMNT